MPREYRNISQYESEILELRNVGFTYREIGEKLGFSESKIKEFFRRLRIKKQKLEAGMSLKRKGRSPKDYVVSEGDKVAELRYILARK